MILGGNATVFVSDMERAVKFYTETLGLKLVMRAGDHWAEIDAGKGFIIGLHPAGEKSPKPGTAGAVQIGLLVDGSIHDLVEELTRRGVEFHGPVVDDEAVLLASFGDPDGNSCYLCEVKSAAKPAG